MSAPFVSFQAVKQAVSMREVLEHYGLLDTLKRRGDDALTGPCPIHQGTNPTQFRVSLSKNCWNCFGGCEGGNVLDFVMAMEGVAVRKAALLLAEWFGVKSQDEPPKRSKETNGRRAVPATRNQRPAAEATPASADQPVGRVAEPGAPVEKVAETPVGEAETATGENPPLPFAGLKDLDAEHPFLKQRGFSREAMEELGVGYCRKGLMKERMAIPIHNAQGELVAYVGRAIDDRTPIEERYRYPAGFHREWELFNFHRAFRARKTNSFGLLVTADFLDVFRLYEAGYANAIALMGRSVSPRQKQLLLGAVGRKSRLTLLVEAGEGLAELLLSLTRDFALRWLPGRPEALTTAAVRTLLEEDE